VKPIVTKGERLSDAPLIVLVNGRTASASEIVAGSLQDNCRASLVGTRTYGKGLIQSVYELSDGSGIVVTVGKYVTPGRRFIDQSGILPDFNQFPGFDLANDVVRRCVVPERYKPEAGAFTASARPMGPFTRIKDLFEDSY